MHKFKSSSISFIYCQFYTGTSQWLHDLWPWSFICRQWYLWQLKSLLYVMILLYAGKVRGSSLCKHCHMRLQDIKQDKNQPSQPKDNICKNTCSHTHMKPIKALRQLFLLCNVILTSSIHCMCCSLLAMSRAVSPAEFTTGQSEQ